MNQSFRMRCGFVFLLAMYGCLLSAPVARSQGGTGRKDLGTSNAPAPKPTGVTKPVPSVEGTTWQIEAFEGGKSQGVLFFEFLSRGRLSVGGDQQAGTVWRQTGAHVVIRVNDQEGSGRVDGTFAGNQMTGTMNGRDDKGVIQTATLRGKRADAAALAELKFWKSIKSSTKSEDFDTYLQRYPNGAFARDARYKLSGMEQKSSPGSANPTSSPSPKPEHR